MALSSAQIAGIILEQLGGKKFVAMTGAKNLMSEGATLDFAIPLSNGINRVSITLDVNDTYRVTFGKYRPAKLDILTVHTQDNVYADQLRSLFTNQTGLQTSL